jgi:hypothetical protein
MKKIPEIAEIIDQYLLATSGTSVKDLARRTGFSRSMVSQARNHGLVTRRLLYRLIIVIPRLKKFSTELDITIQY